MLPAFLPTPNPQNAPTPRAIARLWPTGLAAVVGQRSTSNSELGYGRTGLRVGARNDGRGGCGVFGHGVGAGLLGV